MRDAPATALVTGATGLIGLEIVRALMRDGQRVAAYARGRSPGIRELERLERAGRLRIYRGDLERKDLGLSADALDELAGSVSSVIHAGAIYSFSSDRERIFSTNVGGLENLLAQARGWPLTSFHQISSILAAGRREGDVPEELLPRAASFRNAYEETKWISETILSDWSDVPLRIYRPGAVMGHSVTGETQKFDGPYMAFGLMRPRLPFPVPGRGDTPFPLVTVDLVADTVAAGVAAPPRRLEVLHVLDLDRPTVAQLARAMTRRLAGHETLLHVPEAWYRVAARAPGFHRLTGIEPVGAEYMTSGARYETTRFARFCEHHGIDARRMRRAYDPLAAYYAQHRGVDPVAGT